MTVTRLRLASFSLAACTALALTGCGSNDAPATDLGSGVVTPGGSAGVGTPSPVPMASSSASASPSTGPSASLSATPRTRASSAATPRDGAATVPAPFRDDDAVVDAENQSGQGRTIRIKEAQLSRSNGFVAVYTLEGNRLLGSGVVKRPTGADDDGNDNDDDGGGDDDDDGGDDDDDDDDGDGGGTVMVKLNRPLSDTTRLLIVLHSDNGNGRFNATEDPRVVGSDDDSAFEVDRITYRMG